MFTCSTDAAFVTARSAVCDVHTIAVEIVALLFAVFVSFVPATMPVLRMLVEQSEALLCTCTEMARPTEELGATVPILHVTC